MRARAGNRERRAAALCGAAAVFLALVVPLAGARGRTSYSHVAQYISELGESGAPNAATVRAGFALTGLFALAFVVLAGRVLPASRRKSAGVICLAAVGVAYVVSAVAPCDPGCPSEGSLSQSLHNFFGLLEYAGSIAGLLLLGSVFSRSPAWRSLAPLCAVAALFVALGFLGMLQPSLASLRGISQRVAELSLFLWFAAISLFLARGARNG